MKEGLKRTHEITLNVFPALNQLERWSLAVYSLVFDELTSRLSAAVLMPIICASNSPAGGVYTAKLTEFAELQLDHISSVTNLAACFWLRGESGIETTPRLRYASAIRALTTLPSLPSTRQKIALLATVLKAIQQSVLDYHSRLAHNEEALSVLDLQLTTDDFLSILVYVITHARVQHLNSELDFLEHFTEKRLLSGELGHALMTFKAALAFFKTLSWDEIKAAAAPSKEYAAATYTCSGDDDLGSGMESTALHIQAGQSSAPSPDETPPPSQQQPNPAVDDNKAVGMLNLTPSKVGERLLRARAARKAAKPSASSSSLADSGEGRKSAGNARI